MSKIPPVPPVISTKDLNELVKQTNKKFGYSKYLAAFESANIKLKRNMFGCRKGDVLQLEMFGATIYVIRDFKSYDQLMNPSDLIEGKDFDFV